MDSELEDVDYLTYVDSLLSKVDELEKRIEFISFTKNPPVPSVGRGRPLKFGKPTRVFSVRLPIDFVAILIESCVREGLNPSEYIIRYLDLH